MNSNSDNIIEILNTMVDDIKSEVSNDTLRKLQQKICRATVLMNERFDHIKNNDVLNSNFRIIYSSELKISANNAITLATSFAEKNKSNGISGALVLKNQKLIQIIEGRAEKVKMLFNSIKGDCRHRNIFLIESAESEKRYFSDWGMACCEINEDAFRQLVNKLTGVEKIGFALQDLNRKPLQIPQRIIRHVYR